MLFKNHIAVYRNLNKVLKKCRFHCWRQVLPLLLHPNRADLCDLFTKVPASACE